MSAVNPSPERAAAGRSVAASYELSNALIFAGMPSDERWRWACEITSLRSVSGPRRKLGDCLNSDNHRVRLGSDIERKVVRALTGLGEGYVLLPPTQSGLASDAPQRPGPVGPRVDVAMMLSGQRDALRHQTEATLRCIVSVALRTKISIPFCQLIANTRRCGDRQAAIRSIGP
jgi:hypothetical protein